ncbi:ferredoxin [Spiroplasma endosymbiont of Labia minor]|uniref:ferredoxin n=1 Tax=Spiroplasma endosymbiont of Labia minor TaxID=3066305 RepID=UPI0030D3EA9F
MKKTFVNKELCIGCLACIEIDETNTLYLDEDGLANAYDNDLELVEAQMVCPTGAITIKS